MTCARCQGKGITRITGRNEAEFCGCSKGREEQQKKRVVTKHPALAAPYKADTPQPLDPYAYVGEKL